MLKLMIVDDEELERNGLKRSIDWSSLGIEVTGVYENGRIALDAIRTNQPDILLTDIRMPVMDGLTLAQKVSEIHKNIKIVFVSGYEDFHYAKKAVELNAYKYILKPYEIDELVMTMKDITTQCEKEKNKIFEQEILERKLEESLPLLKDRFCRDILDGIIRDEAKIKKKIEFLEVLLYTEGLYFVNLMEINNYSSLLENREESYKQVMPVYIIEKIKEGMNGEHGICIGISEYLYAVLLSYPKMQNSETANYQCIERIKSELAGCFHADLTIGISRECQNLMGLNTAFKQAHEAVKHKFAIGSDQIITYEDICEKDTLELDGILESVREKILAKISTGDGEGITEQVDILFHALIGYKAENGYIQSACIDIINGVSRFLSSLSIYVDEIFGKDVSLIGKILRFETIHDIHQWMKNILLCIAESVLQKSCTRNHRIISQMKDTILKRYAEDLTVADIASSVYLSTSYAASLFKKESGQTVMDFVIQTRIEMAKEMLKNPNCKINEVSYSVGYDNIPYFSSLFKNIVGVSPKDYRDRLSDTMATETL